MIAASALFVVGALVLLIVGTFQDGLELIFASIGASIVAALLLFFGVLVDRRRPAAEGYGYGAAEEPARAFGVGGAPEQAADAFDREPLVPEEAVGTGVPADAALEEGPPVMLGEDETAVVEPATGARAATGARRASARKPVPRKAAPAKTKAAAKKATAKKATAKPKAAAKKTTAKTTAKAAPRKTTAKPTTKKTAPRRPTRPSTPPGGGA